MPRRADRIEAWLRGPLPGIAPQLQPVAYALIQAREDLVEVARDLTPDELWQVPGDAAPAGYHLKHLAGSLGRLLTYARGEPLTEDQRAALAAEQQAGDTVGDLLARATGTIEQALTQLRETTPERLLDPRSVGRAGLPSTVLGLLFHAAEHTARHTGQLITTVKIVRSGDRH